jgi:DNA excision repair protein ERCC-2
VIVEKKFGNALVVFPSYDFLERVLAIYEALCGREGVVAQTRGMREGDSAEFLSRFVSGAAITGFVVAGGVFSEAVDLVGDRLNCVVVCGVCLPKVGTTRELIRSWFDSLGRDGFLYAYVIPAMSKVAQAMGRVIRAPDDHGCVALLDERFSRRMYRDCLPAHYATIRYVSGEEAFCRAVEDVEALVE